MKTAIATVLPRWRGLPAYMCCRSIQRDGREGGFMVTEWIAGIALLVIPAFLIVFSLVQVPPRKNLTQVASAAAARAYVQALDQSQADAAARAAAADAIVAEVGESHRSDIESELLSGSGRISISVSESNGYCPGEEVTVEITMPMPTSFNPSEPGSALFPWLTLSSSSTERINDYAELVDNSDHDVSEPDFDYDVEREPCGP